MSLLSSASMFTILFSGCVSGSSVSSDSSSCTNLVDGTTDIGDDAPFFFEVARQLRVPVLSDLNRM